MASVVGVIMKSTDRDAFREAVFNRDGNRCVICNARAVDAHHLYERALWPDGGYIVDNGVSLCEEHHIEAETTKLPVWLLAEMAGIVKVPLPPTLESGHEYDKWGNIILPDGRRMQGPLASFDRKDFLVKAGVEFTPWVKYPRTPHLPWSLGREVDDYENSYYTADTKGDYDVVITEKLDGENTSIYKDYVHARSLDSGYHPSRTWVKNFAAQWQHELEPGVRVCGENLYASHSIVYNSLPSYFIGFSVWDKDACLSWNDTLEYFEILGIEHPRILFEGNVEDGIAWCQNISDPESQLALWSDVSEGYVFRPKHRIYMNEWNQCVGKYVRPNHVTTATHWKSSTLEKNGLRI